MQRFTLLHDGSKQGWQTAYLAFHVAAHLGAPLLGLIVDTDHDKSILSERAAQVEVGARAAEVDIRTQIISDFSVDAVMEHLEESNGFFVPRRLIPDEKTARLFQEFFACPLWLVSKRPEAKGIVVLVDAPREQAALITYASVLSHRLEQTLTGLILKDHFAQITQSETDFPWLTLVDFSRSTIGAALDRISTSLLILPIEQFSLSDVLPLNCVIYPADKDA